VWRKEICKTETLAAEAAARVHTTVQGAYEKSGPVQVSEKDQNGAQHVLLHTTWARHIWTGLVCGMYFFTHHVLDRCMACVASHNMDYFGMCTFTPHRTNRFRACVGPYNME